jgi:septal ring factor EnvC (AmiA/AmiB activator)
MPLLPVSLQWSRLLRLAAALASSLVLVACGAYIKAQHDTRPGGAIDQAKAQAERDRKREAEINIRLQDELLYHHREIKRIEDRIQAAQSELSKQNQALEDALRTRKISQARHDQLKYDLSAIQFDMGSIETQNRIDKGSKPDPAGQAEKEKRLAALEQRKKELETAMGALVRR